MSMKTIEEAVRENFLYKSYGYYGLCEESIHKKIFNTGVEFAQQFYLIERDQYADIDLNQKEELQSNMPILVKYLNEYGETTYDIFAEYYPSLEDPIYTHWRPINLK